MTGYQPDGSYKVPSLWKPPVPPRQTLMVNTDREADDQCSECRGHGRHNPDCSELASKSEQDAALFRDTDFRFVPFHQLEHAPFCAEVPLAQQLAWYDEYAGRSVEVLVTHLYAKRDELIALGRARGTKGFETYGDSLCHNPDPMSEADEELGDAVWYVAEYLRRQRTKVAHPPTTSCS